MISTSALPSNVKPRSLPAFFTLSSWAGRLPVPKKTVILLHQWAYPGVMPGLFLGVHLLSVLREKAKPFSLMTLLLLPASSGDALAGLLRLRSMLIRTYAKPSLLPDCDTASQHAGAPYPTD